MAGKRTHIEVSTAEVIAIFHSYQINKCNWSMIYHYMKEICILFRKPAQELYSNADNDKIQGLWEGVSAGTSDRVPRSQGGARESLKGPIALSIDVLFWFFLPFWGVFSTIFSLFRKIILENSLKLLNYGCWSSLTFTLLKKYSDLLDHKSSSLREV